MSSAVLLDRVVAPRYSGALASVSTTTQLYNRFSAENVRGRNRFSGCVWGRFHIFSSTARGARALNFFSGITIIHRRELRV